MSYDTRETFKRKYTERPPQAVSQAVKDTKTWKEANIDGILGISGTDILKNDRKLKLKANYNLVNSIYDPSDFNYVTKPYGLDGSELNLNQPSKMRDYNLIINKINLLKGEELSRPFNYTVMAINGEAVSIKEKVLSEVVKKTALSEIANILGEDLSEAPQMSEEEPRSFQELEKWKNYSLQDIREKWGNELLKYLEYELDLHNIFQELWEHAIIGSCEIGHVGIINGEPSVRTCNPMYCDWDRNPTNNKIQDGDWFREDRKMTFGQIVDEFGEYLTDAEVKKLDKNLINSAASAEQPIGFFSFKPNNVDETHTSNTLYTVYTVTWKSLKKIGFLIDPNVEDESIIVDESFKADKNGNACILIFKLSTIFFFSVLFLIKFWYSSR